MLEEQVLPHLENDDIARIDALARRHGVTRGEMLRMLLHVGLVENDGGEAPPASHRRPVGGGS